MSHLSLVIELRPDDVARAALEETMEAYASGVNLALETGRRLGTTGKVTIQKACYYDVRDWGLNANLAVRAIETASSLMKADKEHRKAYEWKLRQYQDRLKAFQEGKRRRKPRKPKQPSPSVKKPNSIDYDQRILSFPNRAPGTVSISTTCGRLKGIPYRAKLEWVPHLASFKKATLFKRGRRYYLSVNVEVAMPIPESDGTFIGVDLGMENLVTTSDGEHYPSDEIWRVKEHRQQVRSSLQRKRTYGARRRLKALSGKDKRFVRDANHRVSKAIVAKAVQQNKGIRLEDLSGIRTTSKMGGDNRKRLSRWPFFQLRQFIAYKAELAGVPFELVNPKYTSQTCSNCGERDKRSRKSRSEFVCRHCGYAADADVNAAMNISNGGVVNRPEVRPTPRHVGVRPSRPAG